MTKLTAILLFLFVYTISFGQTINEPFPQEKMKSDLAIFKDIRQKANSGLYKHRSRKEIDSIYYWADDQIKKSSTYLDFYNIICELTDFEGSLHNETYLPKNVFESLRKETFGYFPYPIKWIDGKWIINIKDEEIPLGAEIVSINKVAMPKIIQKLYKYYTTDGQNITGKRIGIRGHFARYYRLNYGQQKKFEVVFKRHQSNSEERIELNSVSYAEYYKNFNDDRYSKPFDQIYYVNLKENQKYKYEQMDSSTGVLTIYTFNMGNGTTKEHKNYVAFLDSVFSKIKTENLKNLIVDVRQNGGGTDPNDIVTYSYLTQRNFQENKQAWISFRKIPDLKYIDSKIPKFLRPILIGKYNKLLQKDFYVENDKRFYQGPLSNDHKVWNPNNNAFTGKIYLLISPAVASAGSLFAAMVAGNKNTTVIGEETMGGYYGHNGHTPISYILPNSKIKTTFSIVNLEQDVPQKPNQMYNRGIIPDLEVTQTYEDYLKNEDTQMNYVIELLKE